VRDLTRDLAGQVGQRLDSRLDAGPGAPLAVALSGGGDSLALTLLAADWARRRDRPLLVLTVDHGLNPASVAWTRACADTAGRIGAQFRALRWRGPHPSSGLPAAARRARHALLAEAARTAGARVILMGHTADDVAEAARMRRSGSTTPSPREWSPSPAWPEGRGIFLLRPLLEARREALRTWLAARGETWIDDPANADPRFARSRARAGLAMAGDPAPPHPEAPGDGGILASEVRQTDFGLALDQAAFRRADLAEALRVAGAACLSAAGTSRPPRAAALRALREQLMGDNRVQASLAGAEVLVRDGRILWGRTAGEMARSGARDLMLAAGETGVFDGRFEVEADGPATVTRLAGRIARLASTSRARLAAIPPAFRGGLPAVERQDGVHLAGAPGSGVRLRPLALGRLAAACGAVASESGLTG
jgi:tRNA(Ile)-lysidine synthase